MESLNVDFVYIDDKDRELVELVETKFPFFVNFVDEKTLEGKKEGRRIRGMWGATISPFVQIKDERGKVLKVFYSEVNSAVQQLIKYVNNVLEVKVKKLNERAVIPTYKHYTDVGMDITAIDMEYDVERDRYIYHTGLAFELPEGHGMFIFPRSSNTKTEAYLPNSVGILDVGYRGELLVIYKNRTEGSFDPEAGHYMHANINLAPYQIGDKVAQIVILPYPKVQFTEVQELSDSDRGTDGGLNRNDQNFK